MSLSFETCPCENITLQEGTRDWGLLANFSVCVCVLRNMFGVIWAEKQKCRRFWCFQLQVFLRKATQWERALQLVAELPEHSLHGNAIAYNAVPKLCGQTWGSAGCQRVRWFHEAAKITFSQLTSWSSHAILCFNGNVSIGAKHLCSLPSEKKT